MSELVKEKTIRLNGKDFKLRFDFLAITEFEKSTGKNFFKIGTGFSGTDTVFLIQSMIISGGENITFKEVAKGMSPSNMAEINTIINELIADGKVKNEENTATVGSIVPLEEKHQN